MGASRDDFNKYPRTPHLFGSKGTDDDKHLGRKESEAFIADPSLVVEEKIDGTKSDIEELFDKLEAKAEPRDVECQILIDEPIGMKTTIRLDTGETVSIEPLTDAEKQRNLGFV